MGELLLLINLVLLVNWVLLMVALPVAQLVADIQLPPLGELAWKVGVVVVAQFVAAVVVALLISPLLGTLVGIVVFWGVMFKLFDLDVWAMVVIIIVSKVIEAGAMKLLGLGAGLI